MKMSPAKMPRIFGSYLAIPRLSNYRNTFSSWWSLNVIIGDSETDLMSSGASHGIILDYIKRDDAPGLESFLQTRHVNIDDGDEEGNTPLHVAASRGKKNIVSVLIGANADLTAEDAMKCTPLHLAARDGHSDVVLELIEAGAPINQTDIGLWTPFMWACHFGHLSTVNVFLTKEADIHLRGLEQVAALNWAAGRNHVGVVRRLLEFGMKPDLGDKYGTTALIWAARKGYSEIIKLLIEAGAYVDAVGMYSWTPLLVATEGNYLDIVGIILDKNPNVNKVNKEGLTALGIASKEGFEEIAFKLISYGAHINLQDKSGNTNLINATKGGYKSIVEFLIKKYVDVNIKGKEGKTALHWAIDKNHTSIAKLLLNANPDLEVRSNDGDTPLLRAVKNRNADIVQLLLDKNAKISAVDKKHDTALHISMRARNNSDERLSKAIVEILLRNPKHSHLLYRPNRTGETPYSIDVNSNKPILSQVFGARKLNTNEDGENILGYDLYSSSLADILTEPSLTTPITVGLYAKWGSGKSFLLGKLRKEMQNFTREWIDRTFHASALLFVVLLHIVAIIGLIALVLAYSVGDMGPPSGYVGISAMIISLIIAYALVFLLKLGTHKFDNFMGINATLTTKFKSLKLVLQVMFCHPAGPDFKKSEAEIQPLRLLFTDQTKVITSAGGQNSVTQMIGSLYDSIELQYGKFASRLFRAFRPTPVKSTSCERWRRLCCIPYVVIYLMSFICALICVMLIIIEIQYHRDPILKSEKIRDLDEDDDDFKTNMTPDDDAIEEKWILGLLIALATMLVIVIVSNFHTIGRCVQALFFSQRQHLQRAVAKLDLVKSEGYLQAVKEEVNLLLQMVKCLDSFTGQDSRMVVVVDGLDSCEQNKVISVLDAVHMLFSDTGSPFIIILAIDPHVIIKAIELNLNRAYSDTSIGGNAYLRNIVHLPFFLQNSGLRKVKVAQALSTKLKNKFGAIDETEPLKRNSTNKSSKRIRQAESVASSIGSRVNVMSASIGEPSDWTKILLTDDYFSDVNPRSLRRLMNVIYVMGRLLKAFHIDFNWYRLSSWVNITEQWPYRTSWVIVYMELNEEKLDDFLSLKSIYDKIKNMIPTQKDLEPLLEMDRDEKKLESFLSLHKKSITLCDVKMFLPFTINLDPYLKKIIKEEIHNLAEFQNLEDIGLKFTAPSLPAGGGLTRRQANELSRKMIDPTVTNPHVPYGMYVPGYHHQGPPGPNTFYDMFKPYGQRLLPQEKTDSLMKLPVEFLNISLSSKSTEEICVLIGRLPGLSSNKVESYCQIVSAQNINGQVLQTCDLNELKTVFNMTFGDWEIFKSTMQALRHQEKSMKSIQLHTKPVDSEESSATEKKKFGYTSTSEKQVTMEDAMITGLLSTLNEEAHNDVMSEELENSIVESPEELSRPSWLPKKPNSIDFSGSSRSRPSDTEVIYISHQGTPISVKREFDVELGAKSRRSSISLLTATSSWQNSHSDMPGLISVPTSPSVEYDQMSSSNNSRYGVPRIRQDSFSFDIARDFPSPSWMPSTVPSTPSRRRTVSHNDMDIKYKSKINQPHFYQNAFDVFTSFSVERLDNQSTTDKKLLKRLSTSSERAYRGDIEIEEDEEDTCSSPEQLTVARKPSPDSSRRIAVQNIFKTSPDKNEDLSTVLPDGKSVKMKDM